jgi:hypothetical protein
VQLAYLGFSDLNCRGVSGLASAYMSPIKCPDMPFSVWHEKVVLDDD